MVVLCFFLRKCWLSKYVCGAIKIFMSFSFSFFIIQSLQVMLFSITRSAFRHSWRKYENITKPCIMKQFPSVIGLRRPLFECETSHRCFAMIHLATNTTIKMIESVAPPHTPHEYLCRGTKLDVSCCLFSFHLFLS